MTIKVLHYDLIEMDTYVCRLCNTSFARKYTLLRHMNTACPNATQEEIDTCMEQLHDEDDPDKPYKCPTCLKGFSHHSSMYRHIKQTHKSATSSTNTSPTQQNNQSHNMTHNQTVHIEQVVVNNFGNEDLEHILSNKKFMMKCMKNGPYGFLNLIDRVYQDEKHPENHTIRKMTKRGPIFQVRQHGQWVIRHQRDVREDIKHHQAVMIDTYIEDNSEYVVHKFNEHESIKFLTTLALPLNMDNVRLFKMDRQYCDRHEIKEHTKILNELMDSKLSSDFLLKN